MADSLGVKIFQADIIYHLFDKFTAFREELKQKKREEFRSIAVFPCKLKVSQELKTQQLSFDKISDYRIRSMFLSTWGYVRILCLPYS